MMGVVREEDIILAEYVGIVCYSDWLDTDTLAVLLAFKSTPRTTATLTTTTAWCLYGILSLLLIGRYKLFAARNGAIS